MVSHHTYQSPSPPTRLHLPHGLAQEGAHAIRPTSGTLETAHDDDDDVYLSASESPDISPPLTPSVAPRAYDRDQRPVCGQTIVNITVNATSAPVTVQTGDLPRSPLPPPLPVTPVHRRPIAADTARSSRSARSSHISTGYYAPPSTPSTPTRRTVHVPDNRPPSPLSPLPRPAPLRPSMRPDPDAMARRMWEIEQGLEEFRLEQARCKGAGPGPCAEGATTQGNVILPSIVDAADEHIDPPEVGHRRWYVAIVAAKVGIFKHYSEMAQYLRVSHASHEKTSSRDEAERLYYDCKAKGLVRVVKQ